MNGHDRSSRAPHGHAVAQARRAEFRKRFLAQFTDPGLRGELGRVAGAAWDGYFNHRKSPHTRKAGPAFADPNYDLAVDWLAAHEAVGQAQREHDDPAQPPCILIVNGSSRGEHTCPGTLIDAGEGLQQVRQK